MPALCLLMPANTWDVWSILAMAPGTGAVIGHPPTIPSGISTTGKLPALPKQKVQAFWLPIWVHLGARGTKVWTSLISLPVRVPAN